MSDVPIMKLILVGDVGVGKTSILKRFVKGTFDIHTEATLGREMKILYNLTINGVRCLLQLFDTAGQEKYESLTTSYYRRTHGVVIAFDVTDVESLRSVPSWIEKIKERCEEAAILIVGNKTDKLEENCFQNVKSMEQIDKLQEYEYIETSAKTGENIREAFRRLMRLILFKCNLIGEDEEIDIKTAHHESLPLGGCFADFEEVEKQKLYKQNLDRLIRKEVNISVENVLSRTEQLLTQTSFNSEAKAQSRCCSN